MLVLLDSSMLMLPLEKKINLSFELERIINSHFEIVVPQIVLSELEKLKKKGTSSTKQKAQFALKLANNYRILDSGLEGNADEEIEKLAKKHHAIVATNDVELRQKLNNKGIAVISLRGNNKLALFGHVEF